MTLINTTKGNIMKNTLTAMQKQFDLIVKVIETQKDEVDTYTMKRLFDNAFTNPELERFSSFIWAFKEEIEKECYKHNESMNAIEDACGE